ncbi:MAG: hypothetical protein QME78_07325 [Thermodesulfobacteriota bacterium]|nr:hypothetical protein [Thermodesulfobacteriota bacterium]
MDFPRVKAPVVLKNSAMTCLWKIAIVLALPLIFFPILPSSSAKTSEEKFQIERQQPHYFVLSKTSGSMKPYSQDVLQAAQILLKSVPPEDILSAYLFEDFLGGPGSGTWPHKQALHETYGKLSRGGAIS